MQYPKNQSFSMVALLAATASSWVSETSMGKVSTLSIPGEGVQECLENIQGIGNRDMDPMDMGR